MFPVSMTKKESIVLELRIKDTRMLFEINILIGDAQVYISHMEEQHFVLKSRCDWIICINLLILVEMERSANTKKKQVVLYFDGRY